jgi:hypothetical protein
MSISSKDREKLFRELRVSFGVPIVNLEITDPMLETILDMEIESYFAILQNWLISNTWGNFANKNLDTLDMAFNLSIRSLDFTSDYTIAYSRIQGLGSNAPSEWQLRSDYVDLQHGRTVYELPANREINKVLYETPSSINAALFNSSFGSIMGYGGFGGLQTGAGAINSGGGLGLGGTSGLVLSTFDTTLMASSLNLTNKILNSDLTYKITASSNGKKLLHLTSMGSRQFGDGLLGGGMENRRVWYWYYNTTSENQEKCLNDNPDIIRMPGQVPISETSFSDLNLPAKIAVRDLFINRTKIIVGRSRAKFSGKLGPTNNSTTLDYESLLQEGNQFYTATVEKLEAYLATISNVNFLERSASEAMFLNQQLKYRPLEFYVK